MYNPLKVKQSMIVALQDYIRHGTPKGGFLSAVLANNLLNAAMRADGDNFETLAHVARWCYNHVPSIAWGSREKYDRWIKAHMQVRDKRGYSEMGYSVDEVYTEIERMEEKEDNERALTGCEIR